MELQPLVRECHLTGSTAAGTPINVLTVLARAMSKTYCFDCDCACKSNATFEMWKRAHGVPG
jgi:hypothetical protein